MSAAEVGIGGPSAPRWGATLVARLKALADRLRDRVIRLLDPDESAIAAWGAALAAAPQAVPNLPQPRNKRLARSVLGFVVGAHVALLLALWWRSTPPPPPQAEMTVELVREMPRAAKPEPKTAEKPEPPKPTPLVPGDSKAKVEGSRSKSVPPPQKPAQPEKKVDEKPKAEAKTGEEKPKAEDKPKPEPRQVKAAHQHQAHRAPPKPPQEPRPQEPREQEAQAKPQPTPDPRQPPPGTSPTRPEEQMAMPAVALPGASAEGTDAVSYSQLVLSQVAKAKKQGRYMGVPGYAGVRFRVAEDGSLEMVKLVTSSGDPTLDIEAEAMIRRAAPFPKPPPGGRRDYGITLVFAAQP